MTIRERLRRMSNEDIQYLGDLVEKFYQPELSELVRYLCEDKRTEELNLRDSVPAERLLGRIEMCSRIDVDLRNFTAEKDNIRRPIKRARRGKATPLAEEPSIPEETIKIGGQV